MKKEMRFKKKKSKTALILALIALAILALNVVIIFTSPLWIEEVMQKAGLSLGENFSETLFTLGTLWLVLAILTVMLILMFESGKTKAWWMMLILGIIVLVTGRIETCILLIIAALLYKNQTTKN
ncbi:MAG: hypothetical protein QXP53_02495 [Candidatus Pacearchaeota archaeon]